MKKYEGKLLDFGCPRIKSCINVLFLVLICFVYIPMHQNHSWKNYMKGFAEVTQKKIFISSGQYSRILVARHAKGGTRIC